MTGNTLVTWALCSAPSLSFHHRTGDNTTSVLPMRTGDDVCFLLSVLWPPIGCCYETDARKLGFGAIKISEQGSQGSVTILRVLVFRSSFTL